MILTTQKICNDTKFQSRLATALHTCNTKSCTKTEIGIEIHESAFLQLENFTQHTKLAKTN